MSSPALRSEQPSASNAFHLLHEGVQRWMWSKGWKTLRPIQEQAAAPILAGDRDVILAAPTAAGKTEAAFLPIVSRLAREGGLCVCVSPLKALINDQYRRLKSLGEAADVGVWRWHGDVGLAHKKRFLKTTTGVLLITPESLEAQLVRRGPLIAGMRHGLTHIVVDEFHAFIGSDRGKQLQSLMRRVDVFCGRRVPRVALSATLGDLQIAASYLRPTKSDSVVVIEDKSAGQSIQLMLRGYVIREPLGKLEKHEKDAAVAREIADHLFATLRGTDNLIFANNRENVERFADLLRVRCENENLPIEFFPHHGNLAKDIRRHAEAQLKSETRPASVVATTTLEMGIDVGTVESIAQLGVPPSVASLRQRVGRSGRTGGTSVLRFYLPELERDENSRPPDRLRARTVQSIAMIELMLEGWVEPPNGRSQNLSTLIHQLLSLVAQHGAVSASDAFQILREPFAAVPPPAFARLLRRLGAEGLLTQTSDGLLTLGETGERLVDHYTFYAAFTTPRELQVIHQGNVLGTLPVRKALAKGGAVIFGGKRWVILKVDEDARAIIVEPSKGALPPTFFGSGPTVHKVIRQRMRALYLSSAVPRFADATAVTLLSEGRGFFRDARLAERSLLQRKRSWVWFPWTGDRAMNALCALLMTKSIEALHDGLSVEVRASRSQLMRAVRDLLAAPPPSAMELARPIGFKDIGKYDSFLTPELLSGSYASTYLDVVGAFDALRALAKSDERSIAVDPRSSARRVVTQHVYTR